MKLLAYDTSSPILSMALFVGSGKIAEVHDPPSEKHSSSLLPGLARILESHRMSFKDMDCFAVGLGPGSFTGLRVGLAAAKMLAHSLKKKLIGVSSLEAMALEADDYPGQIAVVRDAKKGKVYAAFYRRKKGVLMTARSPQLTTMDEILSSIKTHTLFLGDATPAYKQSLSAHPLCETAPEGLGFFPKAGCLGEIALGLAKKNKFADPFRLQPQYLYARDCSVTKK